MQTDVRSPVIPFHLREEAESVLRELVPAPWRRNVRAFLFRLACDGATPADWRRAIEATRTYRPLAAFAYFRTVLWRSRDARRRREREKRKRYLSLFTER